MNIIKESIERLNEEKYFEVEADTSYVQEDPEDAIAVYKYFVFNPEGDGDGYVEVSEFDDGMYQIEDVDDAFNVPIGTLKSLFPQGFTYNEWGKEEMESTINKVFQKYVTNYLNKGR